MERDHRSQVDATHDTEQRRESQPLEHEADKLGFSDTGVIPPVGTEVTVVLEPVIAEKVKKK